jgi:glycosyltransferase involved in cell wall biosynthesis
MDMEKVDVVIPTFNETSRLFRAVESAKNQTSRVNKIWIVDDGSENSVLDEIKLVFKFDNQVELVPLGHSGTPGISRKEGILRSSADWIAFLDADDYWHPEKIEKQLNEARKFSAQLVFTNAFKTKDGYLESFFHKTNFRKKVKFRHMVRENRLVNSSVLVKRSYLHLVNVYADLTNVRAVEDYATWLRLSSVITFVGLADELTYYSVSSSSLSKETKIDKRLFALADFLIWSKNNKSRNLSFCFRAFMSRTMVCYQLFRETIVSK